MYGVTRGGEDRPDKPKRGNSCSRGCQAAVAPSSAWRTGIIAAGVGECHPSRQDRRRPRLAAIFGLQGLLVSYFWSVALPCFIPWTAAAGMYSERRRDRRPCAPSSGIGIGTLLFSVQCGCPHRQPYPPPNSNLY